MLVLVNLKQATVVLFVLVVGAVLLAGLRDPAIRVLGMKIKDHASTLLKYDGKGGWTVQRTWNKP